jgi:hypothetical protein
MHHREFVIQKNDNISNQLDSKISRELVHYRYLDVDCGVCYFV